MPVISINTTKEEQDKVLEAIKKIDNSKPVSIRSIALMAKMKES